jgi:molybdopterin-guanine dinucleotide biosynthesis protein A
MDRNVAGLVLAGGRSRRFGRDKLREELGGVPILDRALGRVAEVCQDLIVVLAPDAPEPPPPEGLTVRFVRDSVGDEGPLRGIASGLAATDAEWVVVAGGDMPDLIPAVLSVTLRRGEEGEADAIALHDGDRPRPLPCVLRRAPALKAATSLLEDGRRSVHELLEAVPLVVIDEATWTALDPERRTLVDVDEPGDLDR